MRRRLNRRCGGRGLFFGFLAIVAISAATYAVMLLWNWLMPVLFHLPVISFWQAMGLFVLSRMLFGGFRFGRGRHKRPPFANPAFREKFMNMSDEERQQFRAQWKQRCGK